MTSTNALGLEPVPPIDIPRDDVARSAAPLNLSASPGFLANHSFRASAWRAWFGRREAVEFDAGVLWVASVLHDIGLTDAARASAAGADRKPDRMAATCMTVYGLPQRIVAALFAE